jgi:hypothetical protein
MGAISCLHALKIRNAFIHGLTPVVFSVVFDNINSARVTSNIFYRSAFSAGFSPVLSYFVNGYRTMNPRLFRPFIVSEPFGLTDLINPCHFFLTATYYYIRL